MEKAILSWSGGKDCALALYEIQKERKYEIIGLFVTITKEYDRVTMHGVKRELIKEQANKIGIPTHEVFIPKNVSNEDYNKIMKKEMMILKEKGISSVIFGDLFLEDVKKCREENLSKIGMKGIFPLWKRKSEDIIENFIKLGFKAIIVCIDSKFLDTSFLGKIIDEKFLNNIPKNVDPAGENGEFHTFVFDGPIFKKPVKFEKGE